VWLDNLPEVLKDTTLLAERAEASAAAGKAAEATGRVVCAVLNSTAEGIAAHYQASMRKAARCVRALVAFDMFSTGRGGILPGLVHDVLMTSPPDMRVPVSALGGVSTEAWTAAGDTLKADTAATIVMDDLLPAAPPRPPMTFTLVSVPRPNPAYARRLEDPEPADPAAA
jgi:hypothetical protein